MAAERLPDDPPADTARPRKRLEGLGESLRTHDGPGDRLVSERIRLGILSALSVSSQMSFNELKKLLDTSDGNLSVHARKLEDAGFIACAKSFVGRKPLTEYSLTSQGRSALEGYLDHMEAVIRATRG